MKKMLTIGEGMLELRMNENGSIESSFFGDTLNAAIYAKRFTPSLDVSWFSAIGTDEFSQNMITFLSTEGINTNWLYESKEALLGIYNIQTDTFGERTFNYWRSNSAATKMMRLMKQKDTVQKIEQFDLVLFTGLSLAILNDEDKKSLLELLQLLKASGAKIAFDPNYRERMWHTKENAITWFDIAFSISDIVLPGLDEMQELYSTHTHDEVNDYLKLLGCTEIIIKCGADGVVAFVDNLENCHIPFKAAAIQVDSTAAGDSFAGTYLAARANDLSVQDAIKAADMVARCVVQHPVLL
ncbi:sugar kinase [Colwellia sp. MSW7]|uniref:Sugar kinase n=1 Tax=Colwellia maritima TaxID=2912588 RepID=A0ABS9X8K3_9GAMM|nr:sugar kinase [Colwellia maritima]MCI2285392.1 sugar kinase [Colwellia maritima]